MGALQISGTVGVGGSNAPDDVLRVVQQFQRLGLLVSPVDLLLGPTDWLAGKPAGLFDAPWLGTGVAGVSFATLELSIRRFQRRFTMRPTGLLLPGDQTCRFLAAYVQKPIAPGVMLPGALRVAWDLVNPLLPAGSYCTSGYRSAEAQRAILHRMFLHTWRAAIATQYDPRRIEAATRDLLGKEEDVLTMVRGVGQAIARPGGSMHQRAKAIDIGGPDRIDAEQVRVVKLVAAAHPHLLSGKVLKERNGCVHFELR